MEVLRSAASTLRFPEPGGDPVAFEAKPKVTVLRSDGTEVFKEKEATEAEEDGLKYWTVVLEAQAAVDILSASWVGKVATKSTTYTTTAEVVGGFVVPAKAIEEKLGEDRDIGVLERARELALNEIEDSCGIAFRQRFNLEQTRGSGTNRLILNARQVTELVRVSIGTEVLSSAEIKELTLLPLGIVEGRPWLSNKVITVAMVHGYSFYPAAYTPVRDYAAYLLQGSPSDWNERATAISNDLGTYSLVTPGVRGADFPLPSVNAFCQRHMPALVG